MIGGDASPHIHFGPNLLPKSGTCQIADEIVRGAVRTDHWHGAAALTRGRGDEGGSGRQRVIDRDVEAVTLIRYFSSPEGGLATMLF